ncbi:MAG: hypothetical protein KF708_13740 [Pirellulales bacterium]|nr:hypothetical protein [Pirellulales bacterium]
MSNHNETVTGADLLAGNTAQVGNNTSIACLYYCLPLMALWFLAAMMTGGRISRRSFSHAVPFSERYGLILAILWSPLGMWHLWDFYSEAFF